MKSPTLTTQQSYIKPPLAVLQLLPLGRDGGTRQRSKRPSGRQQAAGGGGSGCWRRGGHWRRSLLRHEISACSHVGDGQQHAKLGLGHGLQGQVE